MTRISFTLLLIAISLLSHNIVAQDLHQQKWIAYHYDYEKLMALKEEYRQRFKLQRLQGMDYARKQHSPLVINYEDGEVSLFYGLDDLGIPNYRKTYSINGAITVGTDKLYPNGGLGLNLEGEGMIAGIWDNGGVNENHELLEGKITQADLPDGNTDHATHVAGIMVGKQLSGKGMQARGMAYKAHLDAYDWYNDHSEMTTAAANGLLVSNHSYGKDLVQFSQEVDISEFFGSYNAVSSIIDEIAYQAPYYNIVVAAGNDRQKELNIEAEGYNILGSELTTAKNTIVVAAVKEVLDYNGPESVVMSNFSSWGPTNDNRIKPDISANGVAVYSSAAFYPPFSDNGVASDTTYVAKKGTSLSAPGVSGSLLLLQELSADLNEGDFLLASTIKSIIIHTARQADENPGPNPRYGWGLLNMEAAASLMMEDYESEKQGASFYDELTLNNEDISYSQTIIADGSEELKVTIAWTDPAAPSQVSLGGPGFSELIVDDAPVLVNDLDLRITDSQGNVFYPWRLNSDFQEPALNDADNEVDNVEQVVIANPTEGESYTIQVTHKGSLENEKQDFGLVVSGVKNDLGVEEHGLETLMVYPNPASDQVFLKVEAMKNISNIEISDINGKKVLRESRSNLDMNTIRLDISKLNSGVYFIRVSSSTQSAVNKLIVR